MRQSFTRRKGEMISTMRRPHIKLLSLSVTVALWLTLSIAALAQSDNAVIGGFVKDPAGAVVANAKVTVKSEDRSFERTTTTNSEGYYVVTSVPPGMYTITAEATGFKGYRETGRKVDPNLTVNVDIGLQTGQVSETVTVEASPWKLNPHT